MEALRWAAPEERAPLHRALEGLDCSGSDACELKKTCTGAYALEIRALDGIRAVRHAAAGPDPVSAGAAELLAGIEKDLAESREGAKRCADLEGAIRRRYGL